MKKLHFLAFKNLKKLHFLNKSTIIEEFMKGLANEAQLMLKPVYMLPFVLEKIEEIL